MENNKKVLVCITAQDSCIELINKGKELSKRLNLGLEVVTVQPIKMNAIKRSETMKCLNSLSKATDCPITILYSDNVLKSLSQYINKVSPIHIFTGQQGINSEFVVQLSLMCEAPISVVTKEKTVYTLSFA